MSTPLYGDSERLARKDNDGRLALAALRKESPMTDLITAARDGNGPRVEVAPPHGSCGIQGPGPVSMLLPLRRVNARILVSGS